MGGLVGVSMTCTPTLPLSASHHQLTLDAVDADTDSATDCFKMPWVAARPATMAARRLSTSSMSTLVDKRGFINEKSPLANAQSIVGRMFSSTAALAITFSWRGTAATTAATAAGTVA